MAAVRQADDRNVPDVTVDVAEDERVGLARPPMNASLPSPTPQEGDVVALLAEQYVTAGRRPETRKPFVACFEFNHTDSDPRAPLPPAAA
jgi:hypothetical protein